MISGTTGATGTTGDRWEFLRSANEPSTNVLQSHLNDCGLEEDAGLVRTVRCTAPMTAVRHYRDLIAWQLADLFSAEIQKLIDASAGAREDFRFRNQLLGAADGVSSNVAEGFLRFSAADLGRFLTYALGSLAEAETRLEHGVRRGYFSSNDTATARCLARRTLTAIVRLKQSQRQRP